MQIESGIWADKKYVEVCVLVASDARKSASSIGSIERLVVYGPGNSQWLLESTIARHYRPCPKA